MILRPSPPKVEYSLTEFGSSFKDVLNTLDDWFFNCGQMGQSLTSNINDIHKEVVQNAPTFEELDSDKDGKVTKTELLEGQNKKMQEIDAVQDEEAL